MPATVRTLRALPRNQGVQIPNLVPNAEWVDALVLVAATAQTYALPTGALILRINALAGDIWVNFAGTAAAPGANITTGLSSILLKTSAGPQFLVVPGGPNRANPSFLSTPGTTISIEVWS